jgi:X-Pro dipeptidyl-peptidase
VLVSERFGTAPGEVVTYSVKAKDDHDPSPIVVSVPASGSFFPSGRTLVTCTATDASGNQSTCQFPVTVARGIR